jgi:nicotinamidase-related amidase
MVVYRLVSIPPGIPGSTRRGELERMLETRGIDTLVIGRRATNIIVDRTARAASNRGLRTFVLAGCCWASDDSTHDASLATLDMITHGVVTSDDFVDSFRDAARAS